MRAAVAGAAAVEGSGARAQIDVREQVGVGAWIWMGWWNGIWGWGGTGGAGGASQRSMLDTARARLLIRPAAMEVGGWVGGGVEWCGVVWCGVGLGCVWGGWGWGGGGVGGGRASGRHFHRPPPPSLSPHNHRHTPARWQSKLRSVAPPFAYTVSSANWSSDTSCTQGRSMKKLQGVGSGGAGAGGWVWVGWAGRTRG